MLLVNLLIDLWHATLTGFQLQFELDKHYYFMVVFAKLD